MSKYLLLLIPLSFIAFFIYMLSYGYYRREINTGAVNLKGTIYYDAYLWHNGEIIYSEYSWQSERCELPVKKIDSCLSAINKRMDSAIAIYKSMNKALW